MVVVGGKVRCVTAPSSVARPRASLSLRGRLHVSPRNAMSSTAATPTTVKELTQEALQANKDHQYALKVYTERLEAELEAVDKLLVSTRA